MPDAAMAQLLARLDAGRDLDLDRARRRCPGRLIDPPSAAVVKLTGQSAIKRRALARVDRVPLHVDEQIEVAARRAANAGLAFAGDADARAFVDSGGDFHRQLALVERAAFAVAVGAGIGDHLAAAAAGRAAALDDEKALLRADLAHAAAGRAGCARNRRRLCSRGRGIARTCAIASMVMVFSTPVNASSRRQLEIVAQVGAARGVLAAPRGSMNSPKMVEKMSEKPLKPAFAERIVRRRHSGTPPCRSGRRRRASAGP